LAHHPAGPLRFGNDGTLIDRRRACIKDSGFAKSAWNAHFWYLFKAFEFCIPTSGTLVPIRPKWLHEVKYDGFRLRVERDGDRARLPISAIKILESIAKSYAVDVSMISRNSPFEGTQAPKARAQLGANDSQRKAKGRRSFDQRPPGSQSIRK
jgi:hypothetical protein